MPLSTRVYGDPGLAEHRVTLANASLGGEVVEGYSSAGYYWQPEATISLVEETGVLYIDFGVQGRNVKVLKSDALVLIDVADGEIAGIEILLDDKEAVRTLSRLLRL